MHLYAFIVGALLVTVTVQGEPSTSKTFMLMPGGDGKLHLAILRGPTSARKINPVKDITFHLYTRSNRDTPVQSFVGDLNEAPFDPSKPTKFITHGFSDNAHGEWNIGMKNAFLDIEDCNVVCVDWSGLAAAPLYHVAKGNAKPTGQYVGEMVDYLVSLGGSTANFHLIGHSLGAHVSGFAGKVLATGKLGRVTGMDPALPLFSYDDIHERLHETDASFVDIIHTCGGFLGFFKPIGHADFYPNSGNFQPGCGFDPTGACSHSRSHEYFTESIKTSDFQAPPCENWEDYENGLCTGTRVTMGYHASTSTRGTFFFATNDKSPFALG